MEEPIGKPDSAQEPDIWAITPKDTQTQSTAVQELETPTLPSETKPQSRRKGRRIALIILGTVFVAGVTFGTYYVLHAMQTRNNTANIKTTTTKAETAQKAPATSTSAAIDTSLDDIDSRITQSTTDQSNASTAVSDSDQQITVPTE